MLLLVILLTALILVGGCPLDYVLLGKALAEVGGIEPITLNAILLRLMIGLPLLVYSFFVLGGIGLRVVVARKLILLVFHLIEVDCLQVKRRAPI